LFFSTSSGFSSMRFGVFSWSAVVTAHPIQGSSNPPPFLGESTIPPEDTSTDPRYAYTVSFCSRAVSDNGCSRMFPRGVLGSPWPFSTWAPRAGRELSLQFPAESAKGRIFFSFCEVSPGGFRVTSAGVSPLNGGIISHSPLLPRTVLFFFLFYTRRVDKRVFFSLTSIGLFGLPGYSSYFPRFFFPRRHSCF